MQGIWKSKVKHIQKDKFKQIVQTMRILKPKKSSKELVVNSFEDYKLKQSKHPNNPKKKEYRKLSISKDRRIQRDWIKNECWENEIPTHKLSKSILWEIV